FRHVFGIVAEAGGELDKGALGIGRARPGQAASWPDACAFQGAEAGHAIVGRVDLNFLPVVVQVEDTIDRLTRRKRKDDLAREAIERQAPGLRNQAPAELAVASVKALRSGADIVGDPSVIVAEID